MVSLFSLGGQPWATYLSSQSLSLSVPQLKKCKTLEFQVKIYVEQNKDYSLGDSTSYSSEKLLQRGKSQGEYICDFGEGRVHAIKNIFFGKSHKERLPPWRILVLF